MNGVISNLEKEEAWFKSAAEIDWLTKVYNKTATIEHINESIRQHHTGVFFVIDADYLKEINNLYGHTVGDCFLQKIARVLHHMVQEQDIVGRVGGDEFVVYIQGDKDMGFANDRSRQFSQRLHEIRLNGVKSTKISVTIGAVVYEMGDDYKSLFHRAINQLILAKTNRKEGMEEMLKHEKQEFTDKGIAIDMRIISDDLREQALIPGAFCQDYEMFKIIYRFVERRLKRTKGNSYLILLTITDGDGDFPLLSERETQMAILSRIIQSSLRLGDVFTQYSSCQFLVMVPDASEKEANMIAARIHRLFFNQNVGTDKNLLLNHCYPMMPAMEQKNND